ncbi:glycosyltransferase family 2 protein [Sphingomonas sp. CGMCC 1.13654]|uniref:Glycosyltransferase family 2 protein n=1 Tax=Sphingomonas chungangi TaxID=2683589 RepID=A0A838L6V3_9SPHN|nr:glycosyltransferase family 2 protein [Sphingomonas chungangi]MBA2934670.1 glycosyltransferase family 2 protein [Sphingomonas chungangi]MVW57981.1 glycosyltransferase [Sphingomonas chungangi]
MTTPSLSIIIPTFNERDNVGPLYDALCVVPMGLDFEMVFVDDDSTDGTRDRLAEIARHDMRVRVIHRIGRRGLATAVTEGMLSTTTPYLAVIDADMQHDERVLPAMIAKLRKGGTDLVVGSRYHEGGSIGEWDKQRARVSALATKLAGLITHSDLSDPMSGFFAITREAFDGAVRDLSGQGYKILLDICASSKTPLRTQELPYRFRTRQAGESKLDALIVWEYLLLLIDKTIGHVVPARFVSFMAIGALGVLVHMSVLAMIMETARPSFAWAQAIAAGVAMVFNFFVNNVLTYRDRRLKGAAALAKGLASFVAVCSFGAVANVGIANFLFADYRYGWWLAGFAGVLVGAVWNYAASSLVTWRAR